MYPMSLLIDTSLTSLLKLISKTSILTGASLRALIKQLMLVSFNPELDSLSSKPVLLLFKPRYIALMIFSKGTEAALEHDIR